MSKYTLELRYLYKDGKYDLFDFPYNLYDNSLKIYFQEKFFNHFMFYEIGFETIGQFKQQLSATLNDIFPYYRDLYQTMIRSEGIDFMLNKDLKESYVRELVSENSSTSESNQDNTSTSSGDVLGTSHQTPQNRVDDLDKYMTSAEKQKSNDESKSTSIGKSNVTGSGNSKESYELISQGNIGVTSSAELLEKWRSVLINIDLMIFNELETLFLGVY